MSRRSPLLKVGSFADDVRTSNYGSFFLPANDIEKKSKRSRFDKDFHEFIKNFTESGVFNTVIIIIILINSIILGCETKIEWRDNYSFFFQFVDEIFTGKFKKKI